MTIFPDFFSVDQIAESMMRRARREPVNNGEMGARTMMRLERCKGMSKRRGVRLIFTYDVGHHSCGWWKNPDYERCQHLSLSFCDPETGEDAPRDKKQTEEWLVAFFGNARRMTWAEPPFSAAGKMRDVWHYRLFFCEDWIAPILPRGEVYSKEFTELGWLSHSDLMAGVADGDPVALAQKVKAN